MDIIKEMKVEINGKELVLNEDNNKILVNTPTIRFNADDSVARGDRQTGMQRIFFFDVKELNEEGIALRTEINNLLNNLEVNSVFGDYRVMIISNYKYRGVDRLKRDCVLELLEYARVLNTAIILHTATELTEDIIDELIPLEEFTEFIDELVLAKAD